MLEETAEVMERDFELFTESGDGITARMPIRWCIGKNTFCKIQDRRITKPYVLIVQVDDKGEQRALIDLKDMKTWISFRRPGINKIFATIVYHREHGTHPFNEFLSRKDGKYETSVLDDDWNVTSARLKSRFNDLGVYCLSIEVDNRLFAPLPRDIKVLRWIFNGTPVEECSARRRRMLVWPIALLWTPIKYVVNLFTVLLSLLTGHIPQFKNACRLPWNAPNLSTIFNGGYHGDYWIDFKDKHFLIPIIPMVAISSILVLVMLALIIYNFIGLLTNLNFWKMALISAAGSLVLLLVTMFLILKIEKWLNTGGFKWFAKRRREKEAAREKKRQLVAEAKRQKQLEKLQATMCHFVNREHPTSVPTKTFSLRFTDFYNEFKNKVCRPYAS